jgi:NAD dependent epimerase/dehydratase
MSYWQDRSILVTGAGGFIASHLIENLVNQGARVRAFVRYNSRGDPGDVVSGDLRDLPAVQEAFSEIDTVFHLGALIAIPYSYRHPAEVVETNILGTLNILLAARGSHPRRIVHTSTSEVYGTALHIPMDESHPLQGQSPYSASKIGADKLAESFFCSYNLPVVTLRPFNTYGPRQSARAVIPTIIAQALSRPVIHLGNLDARRDLTYVSDTVAGFLAAGQIPEIEGRTFNLGSGSEISIRDLAQTIIQLINKPVKIEIDAQRLRPSKSEVQRLLSNNQKAQEELGWYPKVDLQTGLHDTIRWISSHLEDYQMDKYQL